MPGCKRHKSGRRSLLNGLLVGDPSYFDYLKSLRFTRFQNYKTLRIRRRHVCSQWHDAIRRHTKTGDYARHHGPLARSGNFVVTIVGLSGEGVRVLSR